MVLRRFLFMTVAAVLIFPVGVPMGVLVRVVMVMIMVVGCPVMMMVVASLGFEKFIQLFLMVMLMVRTTFTHTILLIDL